MMEIRSSIYIIHDEYKNSDGEIIHEFQIQSDLVRMAGTNESMKNFHAIVTGSPSPASSSAKDVTYVNCDWFKATTDKSIYNFVPKQTMTFKRYLDENGPLYVPTPPVSEKARATKVVSVVGNHIGFRDVVQAKAYKEYDVYFQNIDELNFHGIFGGLLQYRTRGETGRITCIKLKNDLLSNEIRKDEIQGVKMRPESIPISVRTKRQRRSKYRILKARKCIRNVVKSTVGLHTQELTTVKITCGKLKIWTFLKRKEK